MATKRLAPKKATEQPGKGASQAYVAQQQGTGKGTERQTGERAPVHLQGTYQKGECWYYFNSPNGCSRGKDCKFSHVKLPETSHEQQQQAQQRPAGSRKPKGAGKGGKRGKGEKPAAVEPSPNDVKN